MRRFGKAMAALAAAACTLFGGVATANADDFVSGGVTYKDNPITLSNVRVSDVGAHTANVSFDYSIDPAQVSQIKDVCFSVEVERVTDITPVAEAYRGALGQGAFYSVNCDAATGDDELTAASYDAIYGFHNDQEYKGVYREDGNRYWSDMNATFAKVSGQHFFRMTRDSWGGKASGSMNVPLIGLTPSTTYTNNAKECKPLVDGGALIDVCEEFGDSLIIDQEAIQYVENVLWRKGVRVKTPVDVRQVILYAQPIYKDPNTKVNTMRSLSGDNYLKQVPDFTTKAEPTATPAGALPSKTDAKLDVANGHAEPGQTARVYVDNLKDEAKAKADANSLFWYAYIYSEPQALTGPNGSPFVQVQKEASTGKYYFDTVIPADLPAGEHKISVQDENGTVQAWTPVTVGDAPAPVDKSKLTAAVDAAGKLAEKDYTADSWTPFAKALADAKAVAAKQDASQADVDAAMKALVDAQAGLKKAETVPSKPVEPSKPDNGGNNKPSNNKPSNSKPADNNKPANDKPAADDKKSESKNDEQSDLSKTGASVIGVAGILALLVVLAAGLLVAGKVRR
ncbi:hypothetical protein [uncultured Bifidobacterium sp.]|uniref:hypothetical protein n=1 Tax=uncultured Bifidobacterium sp. TaxID=165187 RepID=UPI0027DD2E6D|nr:hypothetical protein [uncultured Bifidobacterium sp.]